MVYSFMSSVASLAQLFCLADVKASLDIHLEMWTAAYFLLPPHVLVPLIFLNSLCGNSYNQGQRSGCVWLEQLRYLVLGSGCIWLASVSHDSVFLLLLKMWQAMTLVMAGLVDKPGEKFLLRLGAAHDSYLANAKPWVPPIAPQNKGTNKSLWKVENCSLSRVCLKVFVLISYFQIAPTHTSYMLLMYFYVDFIF